MENFLISVIVGRTLDDKAIIIPENVLIVDNVNIYFMCCLLTEVFFQKI